MTPARTLSEAGSDLCPRMRAAALSLAVGSALLAVKFLAFQLTGSSAILSDAMESIVNVIAAGAAIGGILIAARPADRSHPYGHGKIEFFTAAFEGGLIAFAALMIVYHAVLSLWRGVELRQLDLGVALTAGAGMVNLGLGLYLVRAGRRHRSLTLVADGQHVISDFWTSLGVVAGLLLVRVTGQVWLDPAVAICVGMNLAFTGWRLVRHAAGGLLDEGDADLLGKLIASMNGAVVAGIIRAHDLRAQRFGRFTHVDVQLVVPEFWSVQRAHDAAETLARQVTGSVEGEIAFHLEPCRRAYCAECDLADCVIRVEDFRGRRPLTLEEATRIERRVSAEG